jgi:ABC-type transport system involved in multi-copper enzyme maturation permease subunit
MTKVLGGQVVRQTISLFRYLLLGVVNRRLVVLVLVLYVLAMLLASFVSELAIINSEQISAALLGDILRYSLVFLALLLVTSNVAEDYESKQFERLLTMPISRWQYIVSQLLIILVIATLLSLPVVAIIPFFASIEIAVYWSAALWFEIILVGLIGLLGILSLEKIPLAVIFSISIYLLAKFSGVISQMLSESVKLSDGSASNRFADLVFNVVLHVMPGSRTFAQNNIFFDPSLVPSALLLDQLLTVAIYSSFLTTVCLIDFYRKEFNL